MLYIKLMEHWNKIEVEFIQRKGTRKAKSDVSFPLDIKSKTVKNSLTDQ